MSTKSFIVSYVKYGSVFAGGICLSQAWDNYHDPERKTLLEGPEIGFALALGSIWHISAPFMVITSVHNLVTEEPWSFTFKFSTKSKD